MGAARSNSNAFWETVAFIALSSSTLPAGGGTGSSELDTGKDVGVERWQVKLLVCVWVFAAVILPSVVLLGGLTWPRIKNGCSCLLAHFRIRTDIVDLSMY